MWLPSCAKPHWWYAASAVGRTPAARSRGGAQFPNRVIQPHWNHMATSNAAYPLLKIAIYSGFSHFHSYVSLPEGTSMVHACRWYASVGSCSRARLSQFVRAHLGVGHSPIWDTLHECIVYLPFRKNLSSWANNTTILCICNIHSYLWLKSRRFLHNYQETKPPTKGFFRVTAFPTSLSLKIFAELAPLFQPCTFFSRELAGWQIHGDCFVFGEQKWKKNYGKLEEFESQVGSSFQDGR